MVLHPCGTCGRHVASTETTCPFCAATCFPHEPRAIRAGRFARAVIFAGAAIAGCDQGKGTADEPVDKPVAKEPVTVPRVM